MTDLMMFDRSGGPDINLSGIMRRIAEVERQRAEAIAALEEAERLAGDAPELAKVLREAIDAARGEGSK